MQWTDDIRDKMLHYEEQAPEPQWEAFEQALAERRKRKAKLIAMPRLRMAVAAAVASLVVGGLTTYFFIINNMHTDGALRTSVEQRTDNGSEHYLSNVFQSHVEGEAATASSSTCAHCSSATIDTLTVDNNIEQPSEATPPTTIGDTPNQPIAQEKQTDTPKKKFLVDETDLPTARKQSARLMAKAYVANTFASNTSSEQHGFLLSDATTYGPNDDESDTEPPVRADGGTQEQLTANHHQPVRIGMSVRFGVSERWAVETGLAYSYLRSDITKTGINRTVTEQRLHYIGVPVSLSYSLWSNRRLAVYASAGMMGEMMVGGKATSTTYENDEAIDHDTQTLSDHRPQFSANCAVSLEYRLTDRIGIYAQPSLNYYFDNNTPLKTVYTDRPLNVSLNVGLAFNFR